MTPHGPAIDSLHGQGRGRASRGLACKASARDDMPHLQSGVQKRQLKQRAHSGLAEHKVIEMPCQPHQPRHHNNTKSQLYVHQRSPAKASPSKSCAQVQASPNFFFLALKFQHASTSFLHAHTKNLDLARLTALQ